MKQLTCEMCGNTDLTKRDGVFVCQSCGCKYSVEEARKMIVEGTVDVSGSTVKIDDASKLDNYLEIAKGAIKSNNHREAELYCKKALEVDSQVADAWLLRSRSVLLQATLNNPKKIGEAMGYFTKGFNCVLDGLDGKDNDRSVEALTDAFSAAISAMLDLGEVSRFLIKQGAEIHEREASHKSATLYAHVLDEIIGSSALPLLLAISSKEYFPEMMRKSARVVFSSMTLSVLFDEKTSKSRLITPKIQTKLADEERHYRENPGYITSRWKERHLFDVVGNLILFDHLILFLKEANPEGLATIEPEGKKLVIEALKFHIENFPFYPYFYDSTDLLIAHISFEGMDANFKQGIEKMVDRWTLELKKIDPSYEPKKPEPADTKPNTTANASSTTNGGCYVATAVYGSYDCPQVWTLRRYRDYTLAETWYGRAFIRVYYAISPTLVKWFGHTEWFKKMWKGKLDRMVANLNAEGIVDTPYEDRRW